MGGGAGWLLLPSASLPPFPGAAAHANTVRALIGCSCCCECCCMQVRPDSSTAQRSAASGRLVMVMPKEDPAERLVDIAYLRHGMHVGLGVRVVLWLATACMPKRTRRERAAVPCCACLPAGSAP